MTEFVFGVCVGAFGMLFIMSGAAFIGYFNYRLMDK